MGSLPKPLLLSAAKMLLSRIWLRKERATSSGKETFLQQLLPTLKTLPRVDSSTTLVRLSMISTRLPTLCSMTCHREITRREHYRFASKTLMRILPAENVKQVEALIEKGNITLDLYDILGQCTWTQPTA